MSKNVFTTTEVGLAAYLVCLGYWPRILPGNPVYFEFPASPEIEQAAQEFLSEKAKIDPKRYSINLDILRRAVLSLRDMREVK